MSVDDARSTGDPHFSTYLGDSKRSFATAPAIDAVGHFPRKTHILDRHLPAAYPFCVSVVSEGDGICQVDGSDIEFPIPCIFLQPPDAHLRYGPRTYWTETWWQFRLSHAEFRGRWHLGASGPLVYRVKDIAAARHQIGLIVGACRRAHALGTADRIDLLSELTFLEVFAGAEPQKRLAPEDEGLLVIERYLSEHFREAIVLDQLALRFGFSKTAFYRRWEKHFSQTPAQLLLNLRIEHARRALLESERDVKFIARDAGFASAQYFARVFGERFAMSPTEYRRLNGA
jgi:AraC-like DNA-binding protein